ncbi:hypothetical protein C8Q78DRAFT_1192432 [Trametes maxima]|nr:hypothetical protein C8Q78DRAFT_1192432 [Trametes maxima]
MPPPLDRETLKNMKRSDLQRICKDYGIKANLKTEALIDLLIDTTQARPRPTPSFQPQHAPSGRTVSRSVAAGSRLRGSSSSSVIIHDTDEEDNAAGEDDNRSRSMAVAASSEPDAPPPPRTRRAKETQYRLGVGRPTVAGGSGARAVTRSASLSVRGKRTTRASRSVKPVEAAIQEEEEPIEPEMPEAGPSGTTHDHEPLIIPMPDPLEGPTLRPLPGVPNVSEDVKKLVSDAVQPLHEQIHLLHIELERQSTEAADVRQLTSQLQTLHAEVQGLRSQAATASQLQAEVLQLKFLVASLLERTAASSTTQSAKSLGKIRALDEGNSQTEVAGSTPSHAAVDSMAKVDDSPRTTQPLLGKRHRDLDDSQLTDTMDTSEGQHGQEDLDQRAVRPMKKRLKLSEAPEPSQPAQVTDDQVTTLSQDVHSEVTPAARPPPAPFTIFSGPEELPDDPPPTTHLSDLFPMASAVANGHTPPVNGAGTIVRPLGADENAPNHFGFNFSFNTSIFHPMASTPFESGTPILAYPEPPTSPTPGVPSGGFIERAGGRIERNDIYHPHGRRHAQSQAQSQAQVSSPSRPQSAASRPSSRAAVARASPPQSHFSTDGGGMSGNSTVDPSALVDGPTALPSIPEVSLEERSSGNSGFGFNSQTRRIASSSEIGMSFGMSSTLPLPPETPAPPMKRTMYGTELDSDTRFGDFGVEGVATGFWAGLVPHF